MIICFFGRPDFLQAAFYALVSVCCIMWWIRRWDGKKTFEELRSNEDTADIPVVFLTGVADKDHITAVLALNPQGYFLKPLERAKLLAAIGEIFGE